MHTVCCSNCLLWGVSAQGGVCRDGVYLVCLGEASAQGVSVRGGVCLVCMGVSTRRGCLPRGCLPWGCLPILSRGCLVDTPLWTEFLTHACGNITFPQLRLRTVMNVVYGKNCLCHKYATNFNHFWKRVSGVSTKIILLVWFFFQTADF